MTFVIARYFGRGISGDILGQHAGVFAESPSNLSLVVLDIEKKKFAKAAHDHGVPLIIDNTFPTPINLRPFEWGADIVTHPPRNIWTDMPQAVGAAVCVVTAGGLTGWLMRKNSSD